MFTKIYDKRDDFDFEIVNFPFLDGDVPRNNAYGVFTSQLIRFARACTSAEDFNRRSLNLTARLLSQGYRYNKLCKSFCKFHSKYKDLVSKYKLSLKFLLQNAVSSPHYYGDFIYKVRKIKGKQDFRSRFVTLVGKFIKKGYKRSILRATANLVLHPNLVLEFLYLF